VGTPAPSTTGRRRERKWKNAVEST